MESVLRVQPFGKTAWLCLTFLAFLLALGVSWVILTYVNFAYEFWYGFIGIDQHIAHYAPRNTYKDQFSVTTEVERVRLFASIVSAIHQQGVGLEGLGYHTADGHRIDTLLTSDEVIHLIDVAILIDRMKWLLLAVFVLFVLTFAAIIRYRIPMPRYRLLLAYVLVTLLIIFAIILLIGPHEVFSQLHIWAFPDDHKWFFYYEESLMSTMMKAPDLFAYLAGLIVGLGLFIFGVFMWLLKVISKTRLTGA